MYGSNIGLIGGSVPAHTHTHKPGKPYNFRYKPDKAEAWSRGAEQGLANSSLPLKKIFLCLDCEVFS